MAEVVEKITKPLIASQNPFKMILIIGGAAVFLGIITGYILSTKNYSSVSPLAGGAAKSAQQDTRTFRDFAEGVVAAKDAKDLEESGGTHLLKREGAASVTLTSSVVDLSEYEGKKVKVFGETQAVPGVEWFMDVGRVDEIK